MISQAIKNISFSVVGSIGLLVTTFMSVAAEAEVTWNIVGTAPGEPDLFGTMTTPDLPFNCGLGPPTDCPFSGTLTVPMGSSVGGPYTFDLAVDPDQVHITITASPLAPTDQFFLYDMNKYALACESTSALVLQCTDPFGGPTVSYNLALTQQQPSVAIGDGNIVVSGQLQVGGELVGPPGPIVYSIGDDGPAGGVVFYVTNGGLHGMEVAPRDQGIAEWGCQGAPLTGGDDTAVGTGAQNTTDILSDCIEFAAARIADTYTLNGFSDWFLPSKDELDLVRQNLTTPGLGGPASACYWSSSEINSDTSWAVCLGGLPESSFKYLDFKVAPVRAF